MSSKVDDNSAQFNCPSYCIYVDESLSIFVADSVNVVADSNIQFHIVLVYILLPNIKMLSIIVSVKTSLHMLLMYLKVLLVIVYF